MYTSNYILGDHVSTSQLTYTPAAWPHSLTSSRHHLFLIEDSAPGRLHIHERDGEEVACLDKEELELTHDESINGVGYGDGDVLHVAIGGVNAARMTRVVAFKVGILLYCTRDAPNGTPRSCDPQQEGWEGAVVLGINLCCSFKPLPIFIRN